jgi:hypothetical protein
VGFVTLLRVKKLGKIKKEKFIKMVFKIDCRKFPLKKSYRKEKEENKKKPTV